MITHSGMFGAAGERAGSAGRRTQPFRGEKGSPFEGGWRVPAVMWWPRHVPAAAPYHEMMSHIDCWATLASMVGLQPPPHDWVGNDGKPVYFDSIDHGDYILGKTVQ